MEQRPLFGGAMAAPVMSTFVDARFFLSHCSIEWRDRALRSLHVSWI